MAAEVSPPRRLALRLPAWRRLPAFLLHPQGSVHALRRGGLPEFPNRRGACANRYADEHAT